MSAPTGDVERGFWRPEIELMPPRELQALQDHKVQEQIAWVYERSPYYRRKFDEARVTPDKIRGVADLSSVPFMTKQDYEASQATKPPYGDVLCVSEETLTRYWTTSGSTGKPRVFVTTTEDYLDYLETGARVLWAAGVRPGKKVMVPFAHGHWIGLWGVYDAAWYHVGAQVIPVGGFDTKTRVLKIRDLGVNFLVCTPTYATRMSQVARELGVQPHGLSVEGLLIAGEPAPPATRRILEDTWGARTVEFMGTTENLSYHGVECWARDGMHFWQDRGVTEVVDPETGEVLPPGEEGELVVTNLTAKAMPAIRFRTGDLTRVVREPCRCGSAHNRIMYIQGRREQVLKIRGLNVYPRALEEIIRSVRGIGSEYLVIFEREKGLDRLRIQVESMLGDEADRRRIVEELNQNLKLNVGISADIEVLSLGTLPTSEQKARRIVDRRGAE